MKKSKILMVVSSLALVGCAASLASCNTETPVVEATKYTVSFAAFTNGTVSADKEKAEVGETVTVTASLNSGVNKTITGIKVNEMAVGANANGKFVFTMPGANVNVSVVTEDVVPEDTFTVTLPAENDEVKVEASAVVSIVAGTKVVLTITNKVSTTKEIDRVFAGDIALAAGDDGKFSFIMPAKNVEVSVTLKFIPVEATYNLTLPEANDDVEVTSNKAKYVAGEEVTLNVNVKNAKKIVTSLKVDDFTLPAKSGEVKFSMPSKNSNVVVKIDDDPKQIIYSLGFNGVDTTKTYFSFEFQVYKDNAFIKTESALAGETMRIHFVNKEETETKEITRVRDQDNVWSDVKYIGKESNKSAYEFRFTMPAKNVSYTFSALAKAFAINYEEYNDIVTWSNKTQKADIGDFVYLHPCVANEYKINKIIVTTASGANVDLIEIAGSFGTTTYYKFLMVGEDVNVAVQFTSSTNVVSITTSSHVKVSGISFKEPKESSVEQNLTNEVAGGSTNFFAAKIPWGSYFYFSALPSDSNYKVDTVTAVDAQGKEVNVTDGTGGRYMITMPQSDIVVTITEVKAFTSIALNVNGLPIDFYYYDSSSSSYVKIVDKILYDDWFRVGYKIDESKADGKEFTLSSFKVNGTTQSTFAKDGYSCFNFDSTKKETNSFEISGLFESVPLKGKAYLGNYKGSKLITNKGTSDVDSATVDYSDSMYLTIKNTGRYGFSSSKSTASSASGTITPDGDDINFTTDGVDEFTLNNKVIFEKASTIGETSVVMLDSVIGDALPFSTNVAFIGGNTNVALIEQQFVVFEADEYSWGFIESFKSYYHYIDLTNNKFYGNVSLTKKTGTPFKAGGIASVKAGDIDLGYFSFTSNKACTSISKDGFAGNYTVSFGDTSENITLDGFGATIYKTYTSVYKIDGENITVSSTNSDSNYLGNIYRGTINKEAKTISLSKGGAVNYLGDKTLFPYSGTGSSLFYWTTVTVDSVNYYAKLNLNIRRIGEISLYAKNEDSTLGDLVGKINSTNTTIGFDNSANVATYNVVGKDNIANCKGFENLQLKVNSLDAENTGFSIMLNATLSSSSVLAGKDIVFTDSNVFTLGTSSVLPE